MCQLVAVGWQLWPKNRQRGRQSDREAGSQSIGNYVNQTYDNVNNDVEIWPILF